MSKCHIRRAFTGGPLVFWFKVRGIKIFLVTWPPSLMEIKGFSQCIAANKQQWCGLVAAASCGMVAACEFFVCKLVLLLLVAATLQLLVAATLRTLVAATLWLLVAATLQLFVCRVIRPSCRSFLMVGYRIKKTD